MVSKKIKFLFITSISVFLTYSISLMINYHEINKLVITHVNIKGEIDGQGSKENLLIATFVNLTALLIMGFLIKNPHLANYPGEVTEKNKDTVYNNMRFFLAILSIITSCCFAFMIFKAIKFDFLYIIILFVIIAFVSLFILKGNKKNEIL